MKRFALSLRHVAAGVTIGLLGCGGDLTLPASPPTSPPGGLGLAVVQGNGQTGTVGQPLPDDVVVQVLSSTGGPVAGRQVAFVASGGDATEGFDPDTALTDSEGKAATRWVLGTAAGAYSAEARVVAQGDSVVPPVVIQAAATADAPDTLRALGSTNQAGRREQPLPDPIAVIAVDRFGNPVGGATIEWKTDHDDGSLSAETTQTATNGTSSVTWTLGERVGVQRATAKLNGANGSPVSFTAVVLF
jgi:hypothetical protein